MRDFNDEVPGYLNNQQIIQILSDLKLSQDIGNNLFKCYNELVKEKIFPIDELDLVAMWLNELK